MERKTKIKLFEHWLGHPEDMGDIPRHMQELVTTNDIFALKKGLGWKPFTKGNVTKLLNKARLTNFGGGGYRYGYRRNPKLALIVVILVILPTIFNIFSRSSQNPFLTYPAYAISGFVISLIVLMVILQALKKNKQGRRRDFHASAHEKAAEAV